MLKDPSSNGHAVGEASPYDPNIIGYNSILGLFAAQQQRLMLLLKIVSGLATLIIVGLLFSIASLSQRQATVYALAIDSTHRHVDMAQLTRLNDSIPYRDLAVHALLPNIITNAFTVTDADSYNRALTLEVNPYILGGSPAEIALHNYIKDTTPVTSANGSQVHVDVDQGVQQQGLDYIVGWISRITNSQGTLMDAKHYTAQVSIAWHPPDVKNIAGMYITDFKIISTSRIQR